MPDFGRHKQAKERAAMVSAVVAGIKKAQHALADLIEGWQKRNEGAVKRRQEAKAGREVLRTVLLAWREQVKFLTLLVL